MATDSRAPVDDGAASSAMYRILPERMPALAPGQMSEQQQLAYKELASGPRGTVKGPFPAMLRSPELMDRTQKLGEYVRFGSELDPRLRTVASLITIRFWTSQYEWAGHRRAALRAGLRAETIEAIAEGRRPGSMADDETIVYDFTLELTVNKSVSDVTYTKAIKTLGEKNVMDLLGAIGYYAMLAMIMNVARTPVPGGLPPQLTPMPQQLRPEN